TRRPRRASSNALSTPWHGRRSRLETVRYESRRARAIPCANPASARASRICWNGPTGNYSRRRARAEEERSRADTVSVDAAIPRVPVAAIVLFAEVRADDIRLGEILRVLDDRLHHDPLRAVGLV